MWLPDLLRTAVYAVFLICPIVFVSYLYSTGLLSKGHTNSNVSEIFLNRIQDAGYPAELHTVQSEDGYILALLRIPHGNKTVAGDSKPRPPVFLMHPFMESSNAWIVQRPGRALAYLLADAGYDVWMGNARGTELSRHHKNRNANTAFFWEYSWQDIGQYDLPAFIDYILDETHFSQLTYVGFSQGTTAFLVLTSMRPEYNAKINQANLMAPVALLKDSGDKFYQTMSLHYPQLKLLCNDVHLFKITLEHVEFLKKIEILCNRMGSTNEAECSYFDWFVGYNGVDPDIVPDILLHLPAGVSLTQIFHFGQLMRSGKFQQFDYDNERDNIAKYGHKSPPEFDLKQITVDINIYLSKNDTTTTYDNVMELKDRLSTVTDTYIVQDFKHSDFIYNYNAADVLYKRVISNIDRANEDAARTKSDEPMS